MRNDVIYVAGPYAAPTPAEVARNVARAVAVGRLAVHVGYTALVPHVMGAAGVYGDAQDDGAESISRANAIRCSLALVRLVAASPCGNLWVIERDDGTLSGGTQLDLDDWMLYQHSRAKVVRAPWGWWAERCVAQGIELPEGA